MAHERKRERVAMGKVPYNVRLDARLVERLRKLAERERRPLGLQTQLVLEKGLEALFDDRPT